MLQTKAAFARTDQHCVECHQLVDRSDPKRELTSKMVPLDEIGTDPKMASNFVNRKGKTGPLEGTKKMLLFGDDFGAEAAMSDLITNVVLGTILPHPIEDLEVAVEAYHKVKKTPSFSPLSYRGRSLNGVWATPPFLHNGSVPDLWELLRKPQDRVAVFWVGNREFDPEKVGYVSDESSGAFRFDTSVEGNSNAGHDYGTDLTDEEKWELIEYMKSI